MTNRGETTIDFLSEAYWLNKIRLLKYDKGTYILSFTLAALYVILGVLFYATGLGIAVSVAMVVLAIIWALVAVFEFRSYAEQMALCLESLDLIREVQRVKRAHPSAFEKGANEQE